jgi:hypothetical protein
MAKDPSSTSQKGELVSIPKVSSIAGNVKMRSDRGRSLSITGGALIVFAFAVALPLTPLTIIIPLLRLHESNGINLTWLWIAMLVITEAFAFLTSYGLVHSLLESEG